MREFLTLSMVAHRDIKKGCVSIWDINKGCVTIWVLLATRVYGEIREYLSKYPPNLELLYMNRNGPEVPSYQDLLKVNNS